MTGTCHCGAVSLTLTHRPDYINQCNCSLCTKSGALWGYFSAEDVTVEGQTQAYARADLERPAVHVHFCRQCGSTTHFAPLAPVPQDFRGVNMRLFDPAALAGVELRFPNGRDWDKVLPFGYLRDHAVFSETGASA
jgi:hypothetical protein